MTQIKKISFTIITFGIIFIIIEISGRFLYYHKNASRPLAILYIYDKFKHYQRMWKVKHSSTSKKEPHRLHGVLLNKKAWEASFRERNQIPPFPEPRDGYWGSRIFPKRKDTFLRYTERPNIIPDLVNVDEHGFQYAACDTLKPGITILILGGSVAYGAYASKFENTYFSKLVTYLTQKKIFIEVYILASGAWVSTDELLAFTLKGLDKTPDIVIFFNGLNDLTNNTIDLQKRVDNYLLNMKKAKSLAIANNMTIMYLSQPFLPWKKTKSPLEKQILKLSKGATEFGPYYIDIQLGLLKLHNDSSSYFVNFSNILNQEKYTTFTDLWHFSDPGHDIVAQALTCELMKIIKTSEIEIDT